MHKKPKLIGFYIRIFFVFIAYKLKLINEYRYQNLRWSFMGRIKYTNEDWDLLFGKSKINNKIPIASTLILVDNVPEIILESFARKRRMKSLGLHKNKETNKYDLIDYKNIIFQNHIRLAIISPYFIKYVNKFDLTISIFFNTKYFDSVKKYRISFWKNLISELVILIIGSAAITVLSIFMAEYTFEPDMIVDIIKSPELMVLNGIIVLFTVLLMYALFNSVPLGLFIGSFPYFILGLVDYFMLKYRSMPLEYDDLLLYREAKSMGTRYSYNPPKQYVLLLLLFLIIVVVIKINIKSSQRTLLKNGIVFFLAIAGIIFSIPNIYQSEKFFELTPIKYGNIWNSTTRYMTNGSIYSFLHSVRSLTPKPPKGYSEDKAKKILAKFDKKATLPKNKKKRVNIIELQLEAYQDFSKYKNIEIDPTVYAGLRQLESESLYGELTTSSFGGGTIVAETKMITGFSKLPDINQPMGSIVRYFNTQNYKTLKLHPGYGWFYGRTKSSNYLGFDSFKYKENYYNKNVSDVSIVPDQLVFNDLYKQYHQEVDKGKYNLFNQTITYQNHGPYETTLDTKDDNGNLTDMAKSLKEKPLVTWKDGYNNQDYAIINNYLYGIRDTSNQLVELTNKFKNDKEPVVIEMHGDHNPWGGNNNSTYKMLGINLDIGMQQGYKNYYNTPYLIWANDAAKKLLKQPLSGKGPMISPQYMIPLIFKHLGYSGNSHIQQLNSLRKELPIMNDDGSYMYKGKITKKIPDNIEQKVTELKYVEYYMETQEFK